MRPGGTTMPLTKRRRTRRIYSKAGGKPYGRRRQQWRRYGRLPRYTGYYNIEKKFHDQLTTAAAPITGGIVTNSSAEASMLRIPEGNGEEERLGRQITLVNMNIRGKVSTAPDGNNNGDLVRVIFYQDKQTNGAGVTPSEILESVNVLGFNNLSNKSRFRILSDEVFDMNYFSSFGDTDRRVQYFSVYKNLNMKVEYSNDSTDGALATIRSNNINCLLVSENTGADSSVEMQIRFRFTDM